MQGKIGRVFGEERELPPSLPPSQGFGGSSVALGVGGKASAFGPTESDLRPTQSAGKEFRYYGAG